MLLFEESETAYNEGRFDEAAALLRRAYSLHADPTLLFNLARALEGDGDLDGAIESYEQYLRDAPDAPDRGAVEARLVTLRDQRDRLNEAEDGDEGGTESAERDPALTATPPSSGATVEPLPWIVAGVGVVAVGVGAVFGVVSQDKASAARDEPIQVNASNLHDEATTFATLANVFFVAGGILAAGGVAWGVISLTSGSGDEREAAQAEAAIVPGGVVVRGRF